MSNNTRENRMATLRNAGINTNNFFKLSLDIPFGAEVFLKVNGQEMVIPAVSGVEAPSVNNDRCTVTFDDNGMPLVNGVTNAVNVENDPIVQNIINSGYVFNSRTDGRFVTAQTFKMLNEMSFNVKTRQCETGWDAYLRNRYGYMYQFDMMLDEVHKLAKMERSNDPDFARLSNFFTKQVVYNTCKHYIKQLNKYVRNQKTRKCQGRPYVKLDKYGMVFVSDLNVKVYNKLYRALAVINNSANYSVIENSLKAFMDVMCKLPHETPKCSTWKDAFKGKGAYLTLLNICKFHGVTVQNYETGERLDRDGSIAYIESLLVTYKNDYWKFHELLKATIELNNFDLRRSIEAQR